MRMPLLKDVPLRGARALIREDFNVPIRAGAVSNAARIDAALPTIRQCLDAGAAVVLLSHLGRPTPGAPDPALSLAPVARVLGDRLGLEVPLLRDWQEAAGVAPGAVALLENIRFEPGELEDDEGLAARLAALCDVFVMDAFGASHRAHASTHGVIRAAPAACAGLLLEAELKALGRALDDPARPVVAVVGGSKVSTKLALLERLAEMADAIVVGGGIANTFLLAAGAAVGRSLAEPALAPLARRILAKTQVPLPVDAMTAAGGRLPGSNDDEPPQARLRPIGEVADDEAILDVGPESARRLRPLLEGAGTIIWNGPLGMFELDAFGEGTRLLADAVAASAAFSIAGGGDTLAAIDKYGVRAGISYLSTGGGAFLEFVEGKPLPAVLALRRRQA